MAGHDDLDVIHGDEVGHTIEKDTLALESLSMDALGALTSWLVREKIGNHAENEVDL
ncbi:hypothetical protein SAMN04488004_103235 [Loktanella salsilacus]|uniref:Uncharacterized protein n=1 Tax=Loktanella salsilacus TaxID=195913 RepID=A0A1I4D703_9RHOB|nr:hypothetical protein [Loktanella salsilacus]SFK88600.1 hypothetical protein SAMN04488004_103235 [Loktanella salsilacus]